MYAASFVGRLFLLSLLALMLGGVNVAYALKNDKEPQPDNTTTARIEGYMHTDLIRAVAASEDGQFFLTAADDKTARLWNSAGQLLKVYRPPIHFVEGDGKLFAGAISPNGQWVAVGGWTGWSWDKSISIYIMAVADGKMVRRISDLPAQINHLAFNKDGSLLAVALGENQGFRIYRAQDGVLVGGDRRFEGICNRIAFTPDDGVVATAYDGKVRLYSSYIQPIKEVTPIPGGQPYGLRFSPDGRYLAVAYRDRAAIQVLSGRDLTLKYLPDMGDIQKGSMHLVTWSRDGRYLYGAGTASWDGRFFIRKWQRGGVPNGAAPARYLDIPVGFDTVMALTPLAEGALAYSTADPALGALDEEGFVSFLLKRPYADFRGMGGAFQLSQDGSVVQFALDSGGKRVRQFYFDSLTLRESEPKETLYSAAKQSPQLQVAAAGPTLLVDGKLKLNLDKDETLVAYALSLRMPLLAVATSQGVRLQHANGGLFWQKSLGAEPVAINLTRDDRFVVVAGSDGVIRWLRVQGGGEEVALFPHRNGSSWITWNSHGYYATSPGAEGLLGWHTNGDKDQEARFDPISNYRATRNRPEQLMGVFK
ncbi:WD-40 repeat-containing protein [Magnetococcus marinus MC-1]|uniref:WD-40 repeat-containing protein n=1 Tax=Magnetococcus marinus (strain ATCC BAA-1437 / JCM 17883 / MC-1) TaxID=156889 RepID=A0L616_MAGMM|nr:hypothetical protein [Magnetococcus marinus]ABK43409.1 WD-40 repeat-containing protein [Magnetococcus marinus MC-1]